MNEKTINQKIGARIQKLRNEKGYTQQKLSEMIGISNNYLSDIERGKSFPKSDKLVAIASALDCSADEIFCDVIPKSYKVKVSKISELIEQCPQDEKDKLISIIEVFSRGNY